MVARLAALACLLAAVPPVEAVAPPGRLPAGARPRLQERDRLSRQGQALLRAGRIDEAAGVSEQMVARERELFGPAHVEVAGSLGLLARLHEARGAFGPAVKALTELVEIQARLHGRDHW